MNANPLLLTLKIDDASQKYFDQLRKQYFPPERNFLDAHLMLFHQLPANEKRIVDDVLNVALSSSIFEMQVSAVVSIGRGVAYKIESSELQEINKSLQLSWQQWLIPQDKHRLWPHITIQNKVEPAVANDTLREVSVNFKPIQVVAKGLMLWEYRGGPWKFVREWMFSAK